MEDIDKLFEAVSERLTKMARANAVVAKPISVGDRHVIPLCELSMGFGGGGGAAEGEGETKEGAGAGEGQGGGAGGGAKAGPVAVVVIDQGKVRVEKIGR